MDIEYEQLIIDEPIVKETLHLRFNNSTKAMVNGLRRVLLGEIKCLGINQSDINIIDYKIKKLNIDLVISRLAQQPLICEDLKILDKYNYRFYICNKGDITTPLVNETDYPIKFYTEDLIIQKKKVTDDDDKWGITDDKLMEYNNHLFTLEKGDLIHGYMFPSINCGNYYTQYKPIIVSYNFIETSDDENNKYNYNKFGEPRSIGLTLTYNGMLYLIPGLKQGFEKLKLNINNFINGYKGLLSDEFNNIYIIDKNKIDDYTLEIRYTDINSSKHILPTTIYYTLGYLITSYYIYLFYTELEDDKYKDTYDIIIKNSIISFIIEHPLEPYIKFIFKLSPLFLKFSETMLLETVDYINNIINQYLNKVNRYT